MIINVIMMKEELNIKRPQRKANRTVKQQEKQIKQQTKTKKQIQ